MSLLGDLGGWLLAVVYDNRFAVAMTGAVLVVGLLLVARRLHWADAVRRRPVAASAAGIAALVVLVPVGWYLVSPVFIRTELVEPAGSTLASPEPRRAAARRALARPQAAREGSPGQRPGTRRTGSQP